MTVEELKEIALRFAVQSDRGDFAAAPAVIVTRAQSYYAFLSGAAKPAKKKAKR